MTAVQTAGLAADDAPEVVRPRSRRVPITYVVLTVVVAIVLVGFGRDGETTLRLSTNADLLQLPDAVLPARITGIVATLLLAAMTGVAIAAHATRRRVGLWLPVVFGVVAVVAFLVWAGATKSIPLPGLLVLTVGLAAPLIFGALGGVISERVGVVNIAIEGQLLSGAFAAAVTSSAIAAGPVGQMGAVGVLVAGAGGILAAMLAAVLVSMVLAAFSIKYYVDQVIVGVVLNVLVLGLTNFLYSSVLTDNPELNNPDRFSRIRIPLLADIPIVGPALFNQTVIVYAMYVAVVVVTFALFRTTWGLRLRALGEHPLAADTVGIRVNRWRFWNVTLAGAIVGIGGAYFTLDSNGSFQRDMTSGLGFIALAAVIFGQWHPVKATLAALLFGFAQALQNVLQSIGSGVPNEFMLMLPYVITILAVAGFIGQSRAPAASGKPYLKS
ncbi:ABC transporter permease [Agrococcus sp. SGAir0287]|uniref:ABC transporter permease n=1 Tax=Agrococcus sp. SGAir0287 TaxID=2070347 RepID=UPI0010CCEDD5|nr:ABC transporter permease [Agrococcus sp. SGAir0287]QCR18626.1 ABC transporter permease [Agrococcus sp. SGAir0287]